MQKFVFETNNVIYRLIRNLAILPLPLPSYFLYSVFLNWFSYVHSYCTPYMFLQCHTTYTFCVCGGVSVNRSPLINWSHFRLASSMKILTIFRMHSSGKINQSFSSLWTNVLDSSIFKNCWMNNIYLYIRLGHLNNDDF